MQYAMFAHLEVEKEGDSKWSIDYSHSHSKTNMTIFPSVFITEKEVFGFTLHLDFQVSQITDEMH